MFTVDSCSFAGAGYIGAGKTATDEFDKSIPGGSAEGCDVSKYWEPFKHSIGLSGGQNLLAVLVDFDCAYKSMSNKNVGKQSTSRPRKKMHNSKSVQFIGTPICFVSGIT